MVLNGCYSQPVKVSAPVGAIHFAGLLPVNQSRFNGCSSLYRISPADLSGCRQPDWGFNGCFSLCRVSPVDLSRSSRGELTSFSDVTCFNPTNDLLSRGPLQKHFYISATRRGRIYASSLSGKILLAALSMDIAPALRIQQSAISLHRHCSLATVQERGDVFL